MDESSYLRMLKNKTIPLDLYCFHELEVQGSCSGKRIGRGFRLGCGNKLLSVVSVL